FHPCGLTAFCKPPLSEFPPQRISRNALTLLFTDSFAESLCEAQPLQQQICLIERFLILRLKDNYDIDPQIPFAVQQI
ncbi:AraC family transcriptional regulator, partial [Parabacteroides merdae]|nr:AraC family transcriptional regulator [Parabacteroides merdae]